MLVQLTEREVRDVLADLREESLEELLRWLPLPTALVFFDILMPANQLFGLDPWPVAGITAWAILSCVLAFWLRMRHPRLAALVYIGGLAGATLALAWMSFSLLSISLLPAIILFSLALLGTRVMISLAGLSSVVLLASAWQHGRLDSAGLAPTFIIWLTVLAAWLSHRSIVTAAEWALSSYRQARDSMKDAQQHRGELARTLKALDDAYRRLERFSVQLSQAREAAEESRRAKQMFVANVSHELRTPLNIIIGFSEMLALSPESYGAEAVPRQFMGDINRVYRSARHLRGLIDDVLDLAQVDARRMPLITERASLPEIIAEAVDMMESLAAQKGLALVCDVSESIPTVFLDRLRIRQVLLNLLSNAVRFTEAGQIAVSAELRDTEIVVIVSDTGSGIAPGDLDKVFDEFRQLDAPLHKRHGGTGLGLALSRRFVELHGGRMWVESELGEGSRFYFALPRTAASVALNESGPGAFPASSPRRTPVDQTILVDTEEPMVVNLLKRHLRGYQVVGVPGGNLSEAIDTYLPQAVVTSKVASPETDADSPSAGVGEGALPVPVITCPLPDPRHLSQVLGVEHYLVKPVTRERLLGLLEGCGDAVERILVVDDDAQFAELVARIIQGAPRPYEVDIACGGREGLAQMKEHTPDLVLLDLTMQGLDGMSVLQFMRSSDRLREVPVAVVTARDLPGEEIRLLPHNRITVRGSDSLTVTEVLNCVQAILDALPLPAPASALSPRPEADRPAQPAS